MNRRRILQLAIAAAGAAMTTRARTARAAELDAALRPYVADRPVEGHVTIAGNHATDDLVLAWANAFARVQPGVSVDIRHDTRLTTDAFDVAVARDDIDLVPSARELVPSETQRLTRKLGGPPLVVPIATGSYATKSGTHAIAFYVNKDNPLTKISIEQLREIYAPDGKITRWGQLGLTGEWADKTLHVFTVPISDPNGNPLGIVNYLAQKLLNGKPGWRRSIYQVDSNGPASDQHMLHRIVREVAADRFAIGYSGFGFPEAGAKTLAIAQTAAGPWYVGTHDEVAARIYPLTRTIYFGVNGRQAGAVSPAVREFLRFVLSREGQAVMTVGAEKYLPLTGPVADEALAELQ